MRYNPLCVITCVIQATLATSLVAAGLDNDADFKITASDGESQDEFGTSVAVSGDVAIVGAPNEDTNGSNAGAAYIYRFNGSSWVQEDKLLADDGDASDEFGISVTIDGDIAMVGATGDDDNGSAAGAVYVFSYDGSGWNQISKLKASDGTSNDEFGISVSVSGTFAIIGASLDDDLGTNSGSAYAFRQSGSLWVQQSKITPSDGDADDRFGMAVAIHDGVAVVGSRWHDGNGLNSGAAYVYANFGNSWLEEAKLEASDGDVTDQFGWSVAINGDRILVGSPYDDDNGNASGSAYIYTYSGTWGQEYKLVPIDGGSTDNFGSAVGIGGNMAVVGSPGSDEPLNSGKAYVFITFNEGDTWLEGNRIHATDPSTSDAMGASVGFDGSTLIAGAADHDDNGSNSGAAYLAWPFMSDCNNNNTPDGIDISTDYSEDCNENDSPDECDTSNGTSTDCNNNDVPDECEEDCNGNGIPDDCDLSNGTSTDCNNNDIPDECEIADGAPDCNGNDLPDECDLYHNDCNGNNAPDECDVADGSSDDVDGNGEPDECQDDCNDNGIPDEYEIKTGMAEDCNDNGVPDFCDIEDGTSDDIDIDGIPDDCEFDCNKNGFPDHWEIKVAGADDCNNNGILDECEFDDGAPDCNINNILDECELVDNDCNENGIPDQCDIASGFSEDSNFNSIPDECEEVPSCDGDADGDGEVNVVDLLAVIGEWGSTDSDADLNGDGVVNVNDLLMVVGNWGFCD
jgi:hypothetical protein